MINGYLTLTLILLLCACSAFPKETNSMKRVYIEEGFEDESVVKKSGEEGTEVDIEEGLDEGMEEDIEEGADRDIKVDVEEGVDGDTELDVEEGVNEVGDEGEEEAVEENVEEGEEDGVEEGRGRRVKRYTGSTGSLKWLLSPFPEWIQWWVSPDNMHNIKGRGAGGLGDG